MLNKLNMDLITVHPIRKGVFYSTRMFSEIKYSWAHHGIYVQTFTVDLTTHCSKSAAHTVSK